MENAGAKMEQCNNKTKQSDEIHRNSYEIRTNFTMPQYSHTFIHVNFVQFASEESKHTSKQTLQSHGHVIDHGPAYEHLGDRHAGAVLTRCHSVVGRTGGATPDMAKWISDSQSTLSPLQISMWCTLPTKKSVHCSATSMTARSELGAERERKVGWKGQVGGPAGTALGASAKRAWAAPLPQPHPPNCPLPHTQHLVHAG